MRLVLIDWLIEVHHYFQLENDTLYLLVNYIDRYLAQVPMARDKVQLLGIVALWVRDASLCSMEFSMASSTTKAKERLVY